MNTKTINGLGVYILSFAFLGLVILSIASLVSIKAWDIEPSSYMTLIIIAGVALLLASLTVTTVIISALNMGDRNQALGLPMGSVRAMIALSLIVIFAMMSIFLFREMRVYPIKDVNGTLAYREPSTGQVRFAQQVLTTVSTLVVAVSSFYFGSRSSEVAQRAVGEHNIRVKNPSSPFEMERKPGKCLADIKIQTTPSGEAVSWRVEGDEEESLVQVKPYEFKYTQTEPKEDTVKLIFSLTNYPDIMATLDVTIVDQRPDED